MNSNYYLFQGCLHQIGLVDDLDGHLDIRQNMPRKLDLGKIPLADGLYTCLHGDVDE
jgi:hypothetical protein